MKKNALFFALSISICGFSQVIPPATITVNFGYDEAGNQIYRGDGFLSRNNNEATDSQQISSTNTTTDQKKEIDQKDFWNNVRIYPVPVKDILTIDWTDQVDGLITSISLYQQSSIHWVFQNKNLPSLNRKIQIDMRKEYFGVYVLTFTLKDGTRISKNITKL